MAKQTKQGERKVYERSVQLEKNCMFQYATKHEVIEDTDLITREEAYALADKWRQHLIDHWDDFHRPQFVIWADCYSNVDYHTMELDIDWRDCELENGTFYRVTKEKVF